MNRQTLKIGIGLLGVAAFSCGVAHAQRFEIGVHGGLYSPTKTLYRRVVPIASSTGYSFQVTTRSNAPGIALGVDLAYWLKSAVGVGGATSLRFGDHAPTTIGVHSLRVLTRARLGPIQLRAGGGPALVHFGGSDRTLGKRSYFAGTVLADLSASLGPLRCRFGVEDAMYRVTLSEIPPSTGDTSYTPLQHDLVFSLGFSLPLR